MGFLERRAANDFQEKRLPEFLEQIHETAGPEVRVEVCWEEIMAANYAHICEVAWEKVYFRPLVNALRAIAIDSLGRDALKASVKRIVIQNRSGNYSEDEMARFEDGTLYIDHDPVANIDYVEQRAKAIQATLESAI
jgi:hypothetical protein